MKNFLVLSSVTLPVKRILSKPHIGRSPSSNLHTNVNLSHSPVTGRSLLKVQRNSHKPLYDSNHHIRVSPVKCCYQHYQKSLCVFKYILFENVADFGLFFTTSVSVCS